MNKIDFEWDDKKMKEEYDLSKMKSRPNSYAKQLKRWHKKVVYRIRTLLSFI